MLAASKTVNSVPFLVSALANSDAEISRVAEDALRALDEPPSLDAATAIRKEGNQYDADPERNKLPAIWVTWEGASALEMRISHRA